MIIPVLDLLDGQVVHAIRGERHLYQPVQSTLCPDALPLSMVSAYLQLFPFSTMYIADLNAIQGNGDNAAVITEMSMRYPEIEFWIDAGLVKHSTAPNNIPVIGTENNMSGKQLDLLLQAYPEAILSLDFNRDGQLIHPACLKFHDRWPNRIIIMMLSRVGTGSGVDTEILASIKQETKGKQVYLGGGIANTDDIKQLLAQRYSGVLIASALHNGAISSADIKQVINV